MRRQPTLIGAMVFVLVMCLPTGMAGAQGIGVQTPAIRFAPTRIETAFPTGISFLSTAQSDHAPIVGASLFFRVRGEPVTTRVALTIQPGNQLALSYHLDTSAGTIPPGAVVTCRWEVTDASGNQAVSEETTATYEDGRFVWELRQNQRATILWHDAPAALGEIALAITEQSLEYEQRIFQTDLAGPVRVILYNTQEEFSAWQTGTPSFIAGRAYPALGITAQTAGAPGAQEEWLQRVIPHELSRLFYYQATNGSTNAPRWLDEGLALYNEFAGHTEEERLLQAAILRERLIPCATLDSELNSADEEHVRLAQAQAFSAVEYLMYWYGPERMVRLLEAYRSGMASTEAFTGVLRRTPEEFAEDWQIWLGVPWAWRQTPTPLPATPASPSPNAESGTPIPPEPATDVTPTDASQATGPAGGSPPVWLLVAILMLGLAVPAATVAGFPWQRPQKPCA